MRPVLLATVHLPNVSLPQLKRVLAVVSDSFSAAYLTVSTITDREVPKLLQTFPSVYVRVIEPRGAADARRRVLDFGLCQVRYHASFFYCDFDKVVTGIEANVSEFKTFIAQLQVDDGYQIIGRSSENMRGYPATWRETEAITNKAASEVFALPDLDITAGCCAVSQMAARYILANSDGLLTDTEWPLICKAAGLTITAKRVNFLPYVPALNAGRDDDNWHGYTSRLQLALQALQSLETDGTADLNQPVSIGWPYNED